MLGLEKAQLVEIAELHEKNKELYKIIGNLQEELEREKALEFGLNGQIEKMKKEYQHNLDNAMVSLEEKKEEIYKLHSKIEILVLNDKLMNEKIERMEKSFSWKITKPLRFLRWKQLTMRANRSGDN